MNTHDDAIATGGRARAEHATCAERELVGSDCRCGARLPRDGLRDIGQPLPAVYDTALAS